MAKKTAGPAKITAPPPAKTKAGERFVYIPLANIEAREGFNPRSDVGDVSELAAQIRSNGLINPVTLCPQTEGGDRYWVVAGARRIAAMRGLGEDSIAAVVRQDLDIGSSEALAIALSENDGEGRHELAPLDQARAYKRMYDLEAAILAKARGTAIDDVPMHYVYRAMGKRLGANSKSKDEGAQNIRLTMRLLDAPTSIQEMLARGELSKRSVLTLEQVPQDIRDRVAARIRPLSTEGEVRRIANEVRAEAKAGVGEDEVDPDATALRVERPTIDESPSAATNGMVLWRTKQEVKKEMAKVLAMYREAKKDDSETVDEYAGSLAALLWSAGRLSQLQTNGKEFKAACADLHEEVEAAKKAAAEKAARNAAKLSEDTADVDDVPEPTVRKTRRGEG